MWFRGHHRIEGVRRTAIREDSFYEPIGYKDRSATTIGDYGEQE